MKPHRLLMLYLRIKVRKQLCLIMLMAFTSHSMVPINKLAKNQDVVMFVPVDNYDLILHCTCQ